MLNHNHFAELYEEIFNNLLECVSGDLLRYCIMFQLGIILCSNFQLGVFTNQLKSDKNSGFHNNLHFSQVNGNTTKQDL